MGNKPHTGQAGAQSEKIEITPKMMLRGGDIIQDLASEGMTIQAAQDLAREVFSSMLEERLSACGRSQRSAP